MRNVMKLTRSLDPKNGKINIFENIACNTQCRILPEILPLLKLCERSELVNISQLFHSFSQTRLLIGELSQAKSKLD